MSRHLLIAGTGRAGTSFLVRYLTRLGLETHLTPGEAAAEWDDAAQAGLENLPESGPTTLPYVIKSPWSYQVIHDVLARGTLQFDAVVIPIRDLTEAAASRSIVEMQALHRLQPGMADLDHVWEHYGHTPGGIVYSLNPIDQARLLAVGLHQLLHALVRADIPIVLLAFPRLVEDADYLFNKLAPVLPSGILPAGTSLETARAAHTDIADPAKVRVGREIHAPPPGLRLEGPSPDRLERAALARQLTETRRELKNARDYATELAKTVHAHEALLAQKDESLRQLDETKRDLQDARDYVTALTQSMQARVSELAQKDAALHQVNAALAEAQAATIAARAQRDDLAARLASTGTTLAEALSRQELLLSQVRSLNEESAALRSRLAAIEASSSWRAALSLARAPRLATAIRWLLPRTRSARAEGHD